MNKIKIALKKWLGILGFAYCTNCGDTLWFDNEKFDAGYGIDTFCLRCKK